MKESRKTALNSCKEFLSKIEPSLAGLEIIDVFHDPNSDNTLWKSIAQIRSYNTKKESFIIEIRETWDELVFTQNLFDHAWTLENILSNSKQTKSQKIIIYLCNKWENPNEQSIVKNVPQRFIREAQWQNIKHIYLDTSSELWGIDNLLQSFAEDGIFPTNCIRKQGLQKIRKHDVPKKHLPTISIITIVFNGADQLEQTIQSVIGQQNVNLEYIIIDADSTDNTVDIIKKYDNYISKWISEKDNGIYDAMNKGIDLATGQWLNFMNCGDMFYSVNSLSTIPLNEGVDFYYSNVIHTNSERHNSLSITSHEQTRLNHQAMVYQKRIHNNYKYLVHRNIMISDYLFFREHSSSNWVKVDTPLSIYDTDGISSNSKHFFQKIFVNLIYGDIDVSQATLLMIKNRINNVIKKIARLINTKK